MNRPRISPLTLCALLALSWGASARSNAAAPAKPTHESIRMKSIPLMKSVVDTLKSVKDDAPSKAAAATLADVPKQIAALEAEDAKLPKMTVDEEAALKKKLDAATDTLYSDMNKKLTRISALPKSVSDPIMTATNTIGPLPPTF